jgi:hypothetical protein
MIRVLVVSDQPRDFSTAPGCDGGKKEGALIELTEKQRQELERPDDYDPEE